MRSIGDVLWDNWNGLPLAYEDYNRETDQNLGKIGDGHLNEDYSIGGHPVSSAVRLEIVATERGPEPVLHVGFSNFFENSVTVKSADMPIWDFLKLAESVVDGDKAKGHAAVHAIFQYQAPDIIESKKIDSPSGRIKQVLEYGLMESSVWANASQGLPVAILNPSIPTLKRVLHMKGEKPVFFTDLTGQGNEYWQELQKVMKELRYNNPPQRMALSDLPQQFCYYLGFSGGKDSRSVVPRCFGFELNPYHPDALNGLISGVNIRGDKIRYELHKGNYTRVEYYETKPTYFRYYGDVVARVLCRVRAPGDEAYNFVSSCQVSTFQRFDSLISEGDVLCDGFFFSEAIIRQEKCAGELLYIDAQNKVVDIEKSCSYENRRDLLYELKRDNPYSFVWDIATPIHDSKRARIAYLRYRSPVFNIAYVRPNEVPLIDQVSVKLDRVTVTYGRNNGFRFYKTDRASADTVFTKEFGYRAMIEGNYECDANEFVQLLDHTMLRALLVPEGEGIEAVIKDGYYPYGCVSQHGGVWRTLWYCRMDVDYKSNFTLPRVFQAYVRHIGPYRKKALVLGRGPKIKCSELETEDFFISAPGQEADEYQTRDGQLNLGVSGAETCHDFQEDIDLNYRESVLDSAPSVIVQ